MTFPMAMGGKARLLATKTLQRLERGTERGKTLLAESGFEAE